jgi:hypothetical protein
LLPQDGAYHALGVQAGFRKRQAVGQNPGEGEVVVGHFGGSLGIGLDERIAQKATAEDQFLTLEGPGSGKNGSTSIAAARIRSIWPAERSISDLQLRCKNRRACGAIGEKSGGLIKPPERELVAGRRCTAGNRRQQDGAVFRGSNFPARLACGGEPSRVDRRLGLASCRLRRL